MRILRSSDVNSDASSSDASATSGASGEMGADTAPQTHDEKAAPTMAEAIKQHLESQSAEGEQSSQSSTEEEGAAKSRSESEQDQEGIKKEEGKEGEEKSGIEKEEGATEQEGMEKGPIPYERFQEVVQKRTEVEKELEGVRPLVENFKAIDGFCRQYNITPDQFKQVMRVQALLNTDPAAALKELMPIVDSLQGFVGGKLPADLQKKVDDQLIDVDTAKELAQARAKLQFGEKKLQHDQASFEAQQKASLMQSITNEVQAWETKTRSTDPDYKPKTSANAPDGKFEDVQSKFLAMLHATNADGTFLNPVKSPNEMVGLLAKAYRAVNESVAYKGRKTPTKKILSSTGSSTSKTNKSIENATSLQEALAIAGAKYGL